MGKFGDFFNVLTNTHDDINLEGAEASIRRNIYFKGTTVFILVCAIIIASVGLNVNSIPVIIGAMLISPVMSPILGFGFGLATRDNILLKDSLKNFGVMVAISIVASTLYFIISPLNLEHPTELLARTNPTVYDVLVALFGGCAGMLEISRKEKGTVISGVAIATALMPPLCTVGYGISLMNLTYILGALYLFLINSIFIALATFFVTKYLKFPVIEETDGKKQLITKRAAGIILIVIIVPSIISAIQIVKESNFKIHATQFIEKNKSIGNGFIYDYKITYSSKTPNIEIYLAGEALNDSQKEILYLDAEKYGITRSQLTLREDASIDRDALSESELIKNIYENNRLQLDALYSTIDSLRASLSKYESKIIPAEIISKELSAQYPSITKVILTRGEQVDISTESAIDQIVAILYCEKPMLENDLVRIENWLKVRLNIDNLVVLEWK